MIKFVLKKFINNKTKIALCIVCVCVCVLLPWCGCEDLTIQVASWLQGHGVCVCSCTYILVRKTLSIDQSEDIFEM